MKDSQSPCISYGLALPSGEGEQVHRTFEKALTMTRRLLR